MLADAGAAALAVDVPVLVVLLFAAAAYVRGDRALLGRGRRWPGSRTASFLGGIALLAVAVLPPLGTLDDERFPAHVAQHVLLGMLGPLLLALGAPVTLALQVLARPAKRRLLAVLHAPALAVPFTPVVGLGLFAGSLFLLYLTPLFELSLRSPLVHGLVHAHFLVAGSVFLWPLVSPDPVPGRLPHAGRVLIAALTVPAHAVLGLALLAGDDLLAGGWYGAHVPDPLADQRLGATVLWGLGDLVGLALTGVVLGQWYRQDRREADRADRRAVAAR